MSEQALKRLGTALAVLLVIWLGMSFWRRSGRDREGRFELPRFDRSGVDGIVIARAADTVRFVRQGGQWQVNGLRAGNELVGQLLDAMADTTAQTELIAENASSHQRLGLDDSTGRRLTLKHGNETAAELMVGSRGGSWESAYVRKPGTNQVYQLKGRLFELVERPIEDWRDKQVVAVDPDSLAAIEVRAGKTSYRLTRGGTGWTVDDSPADSAAIVALLNQFRALNATGFATAVQADSADFAAPDRSIRLTGKAGPVAALSFDSTASGFWVKRDGDPTTFRMDAWVVNQLTPADTTLRKKAKS